MGRSKAGAQGVGDAGRGLALTGLIIGYSYFVMIALFVIFYISMIGIMFAAIASEVSSSAGSTY